MIVAGGAKSNDPVDVLRMARGAMDAGAKGVAFGRKVWGHADPPAMAGYCDQVTGSARVFYGHYRSLGGRNGHFDFPVGGEHDWGNWAGQLGAMSGDIAAAIR